MSEAYEVSRNVVLYILNKIGPCDMHKLAKIVYFADMKHLVKYGRAILEDDYYVKMRFGPVPSGIYNNIKANLFKSVESESALSIKANSKADLDYLSESDLECLDLSIEENRRLTFDQLTEKSHGKAWGSARDNGPIDLLNIALEGGASEGMIEYINTHEELSYAGW